MAGEAARPGKLAAGVRHAGLLPSLGNLPDPQISGWIPGLPQSRAQTSPARPVFQQRPLVFLGVSASGKTGHKNNSGFSVELARKRALFLDSQGSPPVTDPLRRAHCPRLRESACRAHTGAARDHGSEVPVQGCLCSGGDRAPRDGSAWGVTEER